MTFESLVPYIKERLSKHHELYSSKCKSEYCEENLASALREAGYGSDWKPDFNHKSGLDQTTDCGIRISNKSGSIKKDRVKISGSRLTKHNTLEGKLKFLSEDKEDYILCLATDNDDWDRGNKFYYLLVIDSKKLNYHEQQWTELTGQRGTYKDKVSGWQCVTEDYTAKIQKSMSDQLWTNLKLDMCEEVYDIIIE